MKKLLLAVAVVACSLCLLALTAEAQSPLGVNRYSVPNVFVIAETTNPYYVTNPHYAKPQRTTPEPVIIDNPYASPEAIWYYAPNKKSGPARSLFDIIVHDTGATDAQNQLYLKRHLSGPQTK